MTTDGKREWERPEARPVTQADSRADVRDVPVTNGTPSASVTFN